MTMKWHVVLLVSILFSGCTVHQTAAFQLPFESASPATDYFANNKEGYAVWYQDEASTQYNRSLYMPSADSTQEGVAVHWKIDQTNNSIQLAVAARANGWIGFGLAEAGGMKGADMVVYSAASNTLVDMYNLDDRTPQRDDCQDWALVDFTMTDDGFLIFQATRALVTGDSMDREIVDDADTVVAPSRIIAAWGDESEGPAIHGLRRARSVVRFFGIGDETSRFLAKMEQEAGGYFDVTAQNYTIKAVATEYAYFCLDEEQIIGQGVPMNENITIVGYMPLFDSGFVHHALSYGTLSPTADCSMGRPDGVEAVYGFAPGQGPYTPPDNVGGPLGVFNLGHRSFLIEVHYNNPELLEGVVDNSGLRFYWSRTVREHQLGTAVMGDPATLLNGITVGENAGIYSHSFTCPASCSGFVTGDGPVTVLSQYLHMHSDGIRVAHQHTREGTVLSETKIDYWDFEQQGNAQVRLEPFEVQSGDSFTTECWYQTDGNVNFGFESKDEMCAVFLYYYPRRFILGQFPWFCGYGLDFPPCATDWVPSEIADGVMSIGRSFGVAPSNGSCAVTDETSEAPTAAPTTASASPMSIVQARTITLLTTIIICVVFVAVVDV